MTTKEIKSVPLVKKKKNNPRLKVESPDQYADLMNNLNLDNPKMMDIAVPSNIKGKTLDQIS